MHVQSDVMSGTGRQQLLETGALLHRRSLFRPFQRRICTAVNCAAAALAQGEVHQMTRRDIMLLSTAMLSYQASNPKVTLRDDPTSFASRLKVLAGPVYSHMPHADAALSSCAFAGLARLQYQMTCVMHRKAVQLGFPAALQTSSILHSQSQYCFPGKP